MVSALRYVALSGLSNSIGLISQGFALGFRIPPFQGIAVHWTIFLIPAKWSPGTEGAR
jgi:hypothetical protein